MLLTFNRPRGRFPILLMAMALSFLSPRAGAVLLCAKTYAPTPMGSDQQSLLLQMRIQTAKNDGLGLKMLGQVEQELEALRQSAYQLQALFKIYSLHPDARVLFSRKDRERIEDLRVKFKKLEQILGEIKNAKNMPLMAQKIGVDKGFQEFLETESLRIQKKQLKKLFENRFLDLEYIDKLIRREQKISWPNKNRKQQFLRSGLQIQIVEVHNHVINQLSQKFSTVKMNHEQMEESIHEMRRSLRWIYLYIAAHKMDFHLTEVTSQSELTKSDIKILKKSGKLENVLLGGADTIAVNTLVFLKLESWIKKLGKLKDASESSELLTEAFIKYSGQSNPEVINDLRSRVYAAVEEGLMETGELERRAQKILEDYVSHRGILDLLP